MLLSEYDQSAVKLASKAWGRIFKFNVKRAISSPKSGLLYHYTDVEGLKGIIERNELWASSAYFLNDSAEITYGYGLLKEVLDDWLAKNHRPEESLTLGLRTRSAQMVRRRPFGASRDRPDLSGVLLRG